MKRFNILIFNLIIALLPLIGFGQDQIVKRNNDVIICKIKEIGSAEIKYILSDYPPDVLFSVEKDQVAKIIFEDGREMEFSIAMTDPEKYKGQWRNAIKVDLFSPMTGNTTFACERNIKPGRSLEGTLGIIGLSFDLVDGNAQGVFVKFGYKFIKNPDFYLQGLHYTHILKGGYIKPELMLAIYNKDIEEYDPRYPPGYFITERRSFFPVAVHLVFGKQWVIDNFALVDYYFGAGYGLHNGGESYHYGFIIADDGFSISLSTGLKIGFLFR